MTESPDAVSAARGQRARRWDRSIAASGAVASAAVAAIVTIAAAVSLGLAGCNGSPGSPSASPDATGPSDSLADAAFVVRRDADVIVEQPGPHEGGGRTTAYRYFDDVPKAALEFRKRALHPGSAIGPHALTHDEVYYVLEGRGELTVNDAVVPVGPQTAVFMRLGATVALKPVGEEDLVIIIAYPPPYPAPGTPP